RKRNSGAYVFGRVRRWCCVRQCRSASFVLALACVCVVKAGSCSAIQLLSSKRLCCTTWWFGCRKHGSCSHASGFVCFHTHTPCFLESARHDTEYSSTQTGG
ncbi:unnamed protein product, partial [Ectocarpus fasciculatus]